MLRSDAYADGWFDSGALTFESGANARRPIEIKSLIQATHQRIVEVQGHRNPLINRSRLQQSTRTRLVGAAAHSRERISSI